ncbi:MAG: tRNA pseudouridine(38-40) synthase TruA [Bacteroidales bacterium]|nr:tRNA pseudouridine(38-40) synthase TruA [Bacteroidales bacterium]MBQ2599223.1 tRNA pseudouridine(38-40) synthase TruA [Bacteroidales bacterium]MBQ4012883.1 tRNA pseudouridine(38-40) synthase TruA [Bacteroidales bacterium]
MRLFVQLSYDGSPFCGWQFQPNVPSVQQEVERALSIAFGEPVTVVGAGRTDTGVNARHYIAHFDVTAWPLEESARILRKINAILPPAIVAEAFYRVADEAHARFDAVSRTYRYFIHTVKDPFARHSCRLWFTPDVAAMNRAAEPMLGRHDFSSFEKTGGANKTSLCTVTEARWEALDSEHFVFTITADRFLRNMVRATVGTLLEVGRGRRAPEWVGDVLAAHNRSEAGQSVIGEALFLEEIRYPYPLQTI